MNRKIVAVTRIEPPFTNECVFDPESRKTCEKKGINFDIFDTVMDILGFQYTLVHAERRTTGFKDEQQNCSWVGMVAQLQREEANMTATLIGVSAERIGAVDYSVPVSYYKRGFLIRAPERTTAIVNPFQFLAQPLASEQWLYLLLSMISVTAFYIAVEKILFGAFKPSWAMFNVTRSTLLQAHFASETISGRVMFSIFQISLFFITSFYTAYITSSLLVNYTPPDPFHSAKEFADLVFQKKYTIITDDLPVKHKPNLEDDDSTNPSEKIRIAYRWNPPVFVQKNRYDLIIEAIDKNSSLVYYGSYYHLLSAASLSCKVKVVLDTYSHPIWLAFGFTKGSPLQNLISTTIHQKSTTVETFLQKLYEKYTQPRHCYWHKSGASDSAAYMQFGIEQMQPAFWVLAYGLIVAFVLCVLERFSRELKKRNFKRRIETKVALDSKDVEVHSPDADQPNDECISQ